MGTGFSDLFSNQATQYAAFRPGYPDALFQYLASVCPQTTLAGDCATGNGQAAMGLAEYFDCVIASDASRPQIAQARPRAQVHYVVAAAESLPLRDASVDLLIIAQALHWLDRRRFFAEVSRVLNPRGRFAAWCYGLARIDNAVDAVVRRLYSDILGAYWPPERRFIESGYAEFRWPFPLQDTPTFFMSARWTREQLLGYLSSWSAVQRFRQRHGEDPLELIRQQLQCAWPDAEPRNVQWPLSLKLGTPR